MKEIMVENMMKTDFSRGFNHCLGKEETKKGSCKECVKADVCCMKNEREALATKIAAMVSMSKFTVDLQCPHFYKIQLKLR